MQSRTGHIEVPRVWKQNDAPYCKIKLVVVSAEQRFASGLVHDKMFSPYISAVILLVERHNVLQLIYQLSFYWCKKKYPDLSIILLVQCTISRPYLSTLILFATKANLCTLQLPMPIHNFSRRNYWLHTITARSI